MSVAAVTTCPFPRPVASHRPGGRPFVLLPTVSRSAFPSPFRSESAAGGAGAALNDTVAEPPKLPPADRLVTGSVLAARVGTTVMLASREEEAAPVAGAPALSWKR